MDVMVRCANMVLWRARRDHECSRVQEPGLQAGGQACTVARREAMTTTYEVRMTREDNLWVADVRGLPPHLIGATDVERFADLDGEVRDLIAGLTDTDPDDFAIAWR